MEYHFKINGQIDSQFGYNIEKLQNELSKAKGQSLFIDIDSIGGCVHTGVNIYTHLRRYAQEHNATITTRSSGFVASISTIIFLAGDKRIVNEFMQPFVHEPMFTFSEATTADDFRKDAQTLEKTRDLMADFYASNTLMSKSQALDLMANDTWLSADECMKLGFATEIEKLSRQDSQMVASLKSKITKNEKKMSEQKKSWFSRLVNLKTVKAELVLADVNGVEIVFPDLDENGTPSNDDAIVIDGDANFTGNVETEEFIITVEAGVVTEVIDKTEIDKDEVIEELLDIIEDNEDVIAKLKNELAVSNRLKNTIAGKEPNATRNGKKVNAATDKASAAIARIKNRKNK